VRGYLRFFPGHSAIGVRASVYNAKANTWMPPSERGEDVEQGKERAADDAKADLKRTANLELPPLNRNKSRSRGIQGALGLQRRGTLALSGNRRLSDVAVRVASREPESE